MKENPDIGNIGLFKQHSMADNENTETTAVLTDTGNLENRRKSHPFIFSDKADNGTLFCNNCHHIINGRADEHSNHETVKVVEAAMIYKVKLSAAVLKVRSLIRYSHIVIKDLESYLDKAGACLAELTSEVLERASRVPSEGADILAQAVINEIQNEREKENSRIRAKVEEFERFITSIKALAIKCEHLSNSKDDRMVLTDGRKQLAIVLSLEKTLPVCPVERSLYMLSPVPPQLPGESPTPEQMVGEFSRVLVPWRLEVKRTGSFRPEAVASARFVTTMCSAGNEAVWVVWQWGPLIHAVNKEGRVIRTVDAGAKVDDICTDKDKNLVIACHESKCIKILNANYEIVKTINMDKVPRGLKTSSRNELVVCCVQNLHHRNGDTSSVLKVRTDEDEINEFSNGNSGLIQPWRVAVNINGDICVSDRNKGAVIIFDSQGEVKSTYMGPDTSTRHAFAPHGISCDNYGQIFVVDYTNHTVHVLDPLGRFRGFLIMDSELEKRAIFMGTSSPFSIAIDSVGDIWVGNKFGYLTVLKYLT